MINAILHRVGSELILAACDSELHGKRFEEGDVVIDLGSKFFEGSDVTESELRGMLEVATSGTLVGRRAIDTAVKAECIHPDSVLEICGIPHALFFCMG